MILERMVVLQNREQRLFRAPYWFNHNRVAQRYEALFAGLDWEQVPEMDEKQVRRGRLPHPEAAYIKAHLVMVVEKQEYVSELYKYLSEHPALIWLLGFRLSPTNESNEEGFDVESSLPGERYLRKKLCQLDGEVLSQLLGQTVKHAVAEIPALGKTVSVDTKHQYAYVKENNPRAYVSEPFNPEHQPRGNGSCRLGAKRRTNQTTKDGKVSHKAEWLWGYGSGIAVSQTPDKDAIVLAEMTQTFDRNDVTYGLPLLRQATQHLGFAPSNLAADAAFDAWHMYQWAVDQGGIAAIAPNHRGNPPTSLGPHDRPICACNGQEMNPRGTWREAGHREQRFLCSACNKIRAMIIEPGHLMRLRLDRDSDAYKAIYKQRTATERINSRAAAFGIGRPKQHNAQAIAHRNTLIYIVINLRALARWRARPLNSSLSLNSI